MKPVVIFDLDGTLVDSGSVVFQGFQYAVEPWGITLTLADIESVRTAKPYGLFAPFVGEQHAIEAYERLASYSKAHAHMVPMFPGIQDLLTQLSLSGAAMGLWTGRDYSSTCDILNGNCIHQMFGAVVAGCHVENNKPAQDGLHLLAELFGVTTKAMIVVGDHDHDLVPATESGAHTIGVNWGNNANQFLEVVPNKICTTIRDLGLHLQNLL